MGTFSYNVGKCHVCGRKMTGAGFAVKAHEDMHVRMGDLIEVFRWSWKGIKLASKRIQPKEQVEWEGLGFFTTFERCKEVLDASVPAP